MTYAVSFQFLIDAYLDAEIRKVSREKQGITEKAGYYLHRSQQKRGRPSETAAIQMALAEGQQEVAMLLYLAFTEDQDPQPVGMVCPPAERDSYKASSSFEVDFEV